MSMTTRPLAAMAQPPRHFGPYRRRSITQVQEPGCPLRMACIGRQSHSLILVQQEIGYKSKRKAMLQSLTVRMFSRGISGRCPRRHMSGLQKSTDPLLILHEVGIVSISTTIAMG